MNSPSEEPGDDLDGGWDADSDPNVDTGWDDSSPGGSSPEVGSAAGSVPASAPEDLDDDWGDAGDVLGELKKRRKRPSRPRRKGRRGPVKLPPGHIQAVAPQKASSSPKVRRSTPKKRSRGASKKAQRAREGVLSPAERQKQALEREAERVRLRREQAKAKKSSTTKQPAEEALPDDAIADPYQPVGTSASGTRSKKRRKKKTAEPAAKDGVSASDEENDLGDDRPPDLDKGRRQPQLIGLTLLLVILALTVGVFLTR